MKKNYLSMMSWALVASMGVFSLASCSDDDDNNDGFVGIEAEEGSTMTTEGQTTTLHAGGHFRLSGGYTVMAGETLVIEEGVTITAVNDDNPDYIVVRQGGRIEAEGTETDPIVMTSENGALWGGIHICGYAHTNKGSGALSEIGNAPYGGDNDADNSGILRYIRLENTGFALDEEHESNGVSFYGVGSGTTVEYLQSYKGADDGFEFFGGSVNAKYLVVVDNEDDSFDWTEGWNGKAQFLIADQRGTSGAKDQGDCLIEADNNGDNFEATIISHPTLANMTLIGNNSEEGSRGIRLRAGTKVNIYNSIVVGKPYCLTTETNQTEVSLANGESVLQYITLASDIRCDGQEDENGNVEYEPAYSSALFTADGTNTINSTAISFSSGSWTGTVNGGHDLSAEDSFFESTDYQGALSGNDDWTAGWTRK